jgi:hypothetical protein
MALGFEMDFQVGCDAFMIFDDENPLTMVGLHGNTPLFEFEWVHERFSSALLESESVICSP